MKEIALTWFFSVLNMCGIPSQMKKKDELNDSVTFV